MSRIDEHKFWCIRPDADTPRMQSLRVEMDNNTPINVAVAEAAYKLPEGTLIVHLAGEGPYIWRVAVKTTTLETVNGATYL